VKYDYIFIYVDCTVHFLSRPTNQTFQKTIRQYNMVQSVVVPSGDTSPSPTQWTSQRLSHSQWKQSEYPWQTVKAGRVPSPLSYG